MKRAVIYARVSTQDQEIQNQTEQLKKYAEAQGWTVVDKVIDVASGSKGAKERPGMDKVFKLAHRREFDILLFWALDRFSREGSRKTIQYLTILDDAGVDWHSFSEPYISSLGIFKDAIIAILSALAKQERVRIGERTKAGMTRAKAEGKRIGRPKGDGVKAMRATELRSQGLSYAAIGKAIGLSRGRAFQLVKAVPKTHAPQPA
jgi:DNA invertase Pin-like site-specific DNA recombinase